MKKIDPKFFFWPLKRTPEGREKIFENVAGKALLHIFFKIFSYQLAFFTFLATNSFFQLSCLFGFNINYVGFVCGDYCTKYLKS
jgi:hypothetical protein